MLDVLGRGFNCHARDEHIMWDSGKWRLALLGTSAV
jgi:hypothetical protein